MSIHYEFTTIDVPGATTTAAEGINDRGVIVGSAGFMAGQDSGSSRGFLDTHGTLTTVAVAGDTVTSTEAAAINSFGTIGGSYFTPGAAIVGNGFTQTHNGTVTTIDVPGAATNVIGINDLGQLVGAFNGPNGTEPGFLYSDGKFTTISAPGAQFTTPQGINDFGQIVGFDVAATGGRIQSFLYEHGVFKTFAVPGADSNSTIAYGVNNLGQIVGDYQVNGVGHGFIDTHGKFQTIDAPGADIHSGTIVRGINDFGQIVGQVGSHGFFGQPSFG